MYLVRAGLVWLAHASIADSLNTARTQVPLKIGVVAVVELLVP